MVRFSWKLLDSQLHHESLTLPWKFGKFWEISGYCISGTVSQAVLSAPCCQGVTWRDVMTWSSSPCLPELTSLDLCYFYACFCIYVQNVFMNNVVRWMNIPHSHSVPIILRKHLFQKETACAVYGMSTWTYQCAQLAPGSLQDKRTTSS